MRRKWPVLIYLYLGRHYLVALMSLIVALLSLMALFDGIELLRQFAKYSDSISPMIGYLTLLKIPENLLVTAPFITLYAALFSLFILDRHQELIALRAAGASLWHMMVPYIILAFSMGVLLTFLIQPISAVAARQYSILQEKYLKNEQTLVTILSHGIWLRQTQQGQNPGYILMHARQVEVPNWTLQDITVFHFTPDHHLTLRQEARQATLDKGAWILENVTELGTQKEISAAQTRILPTTLTARDLQDRFTQPDTVPIWSMPGFMTVLQKSGLPTLRFEMDMGKLLVLPFFLASLVFIAGAIAFRPPRQGQITVRAVIGITAGFIVFFVSQFIQALGLSGQLPPLMTIIAPALISLSAGIMAILFLEDQ